MGCMVDYANGKFCSLAMGGTTTRQSLIGQPGLRVFGFCPAGSLTVNFYCWYVPVYWGRSPQLAKLAEIAADCEN